MKGKYFATFVSVRVVVVWKIKITAQCVRHLFMGYIMWFACTEAKKIGPLLGFFKVVLFLCFYFGGWVGFVCSKYFHHVLMVVVG